MSDVASNQSIAKAAQILGCFRAGRAELRVGDIAEMSGLGLSTTSRLLSAFERVGYIERDAATQLYRLGPALVTLAGIAINNWPVYRESRQIAQDLAADLGLGANVAELRGGAVYYLLNCEGRLAPKSFTLMGQTNALHATALGKCLLAELPADQRRRLMGRDPFPGYTERTPTSHAEFEAELGKLARRGYAIENEELALGRACIAAPVRDRVGAIVAALSISGPLSVIDLERRETELGRRVIEAADMISARLGYFGPTGLERRKIG